MRKNSFGALVGLLIAICGATVAQPNRARASNQTPSAVSSSSCDRACLYGFLDKYLDGLKAKDPSSVPFARNIKYSENNVMMKVGDGVWATITRLGDYNLRMADPVTG